MFCPQCGTDNVPNLKFCKRCGTNLDVVSYSLGASPDQLFAQPLIGREHVKTILWVIAVIAVGGFGMLGGLLVSLAKVLPPNQQEIVGVLGFFGLLSITLIILLLMMVLFRKGTGRKEPAAVSKADQPRTASAAYFPPPPIASVVEPTTTRLPEEERVTKG